MEEGVGIGVVNELVDLIVTLEYGLDRDKLGGRRIERR